MQNYLSSKYDNLYMNLALTASKQSHAVRRKVGAAIVTPTGLVSIGWNGTPTGFNNDCEGEDGKTLPIVIHAEHNALKKFMVSGTPVLGSTVYVTYSPCVSCAMLLIDLGIVRMVYLEGNKNTEGIEILQEGGVECYLLPSL